RPVGRAVPQSVAPLHQGAVVGGADARSRPAPGSQGPDGGQGVGSLALAQAIHRHRQQHAAVDRGPARAFCPRRSRRRLGQGGGRMLNYVARRILIMIPTLFVISLLVYVIIDLPPGDCVTSQIDELISRGDPDALTRADELRHLYGLDQSLITRYFRWIGGVVRWAFVPF